MIKKTGKIVVYIILIVPYLVIAVVSISFGLVAELIERLFKNLNIDSDGADNVDK